MIDWHNLSLGDHLTTRLLEQNEIFPQNKSLERRWWVQSESKYYLECSWWFFNFNQFLVYRTVRDHRHKAAIYLYSILFSTFPFFPICTEMWVIKFEFDIPHIVNRSKLQNWEPKSISLLEVYLFINSLLNLERKGWLNYHSKVRCKRIEFDYSNH